MKSITELKATSKDERREMFRSFATHPLTKMISMVTVSIGTKVASELILDKIEKKMDKKKETEEE